MQTYTSKQKSFNPSHDQTMDSAPIESVGNQAMVRLVEGMHGDAVSGKELKAPDSVMTSLEEAMRVRLNSIHMVESPDVSALGVKAYAQGDTVHFATGQFRPDTEEGRKLIGHEFAHIVQQRQDNTKVAETPVLESASLEHSADVIGEQVANFDGGSTPSASFASLPSVSGAAPAQGKGPGNPFKWIGRKIDKSRDKKEQKINQELLGTNFRATNQQEEARLQSTQKKQSMDRLKDRANIQQGVTGLRSLAAFTETGPNPADHDEHNDRLAAAFLQASGSGGQNVSQLATFVRPKVDEMLQMDMDAYQVKNIDHANLADVTSQKQIGGDVAQLLNDFPELVNQLGMTPEQVVELKNRTGYMGAYYGALSKRRQAETGMTRANMKDVKKRNKADTSRMFSGHTSFKSFSKFREKTAARDAALRQQQQQRR